MARFAILAALGLMACDTTEAEAVGWVSEGQVCLREADATVTGVPESVPLDIVVTFGGCDCGEDVTTQLCAVTRDGDTFTVTSEAESIAEGCDPCEPIVAFCELGVLPTGSYSLQHGGDLLVFDVPTTEATCSGEPTDGTPL